MKTDNSKGTPFEIRYVLNEPRTDVVSEGTTVAELARRAGHPRPETATALSPAVTDPRKPLGADHRVSPLDSPLLLDRKVNGA